MKLLDKVRDKAIEMSKPVATLTEAVKVCITSIEKLASSVAIVMHNQAVHHQMISQMWAVHQVIMKRLNDSALDVSMPGAKSDKEEKDKPN